MPAVDLSTHPGHLARRLQQASTLLWNALVSKETTSPQFAVLTAVAARNDLDQRTVGEIIGLDRSTTAEIVSRLSDRGLLQRVRDPADGRRNLLRLTQAGRALQRQTARRANRMNKVLLAPLDDREQQVLLELMRRLVTAVDSYRDPGAALLFLPGTMGRLPLPANCRRGWRSDHDHPCSKLRVR